MDKQQAARKAIRLMDLTTLGDDDTEGKIVSLCRRAHTPFGDTAAVCVYPRFVPVACKTLQAEAVRHIQVATVSNFPHGNDDLEIALAETRAAIAYGADEVDLVFPYRALIGGNAGIGFEMVRACKAACGKDILLKVIIESGELQTDSLIRKACKICIEAGADFLKTSTGKVPVNATREAARVMLEVIKELNPSVGFKAAGGITTAEEAGLYMDLAENILGADWVTARHFRFGASSLLDNLLDVLEK